MSCCRGVFPGSALFVCFKGSNAPFIQCAPGFGTELWHVSIVAFIEKLVVLCQAWTHGDSSHAALIGCEHVSLSLARFALQEQPLFIVPSFLPLHACQVGYVCVPCAAVSVGSVKTGFRVFLIARLIDSFNSLH